MAEAIAWALYLIGLAAVLSAGDLTGQDWGARSLLILVAILWPISALGVIAARIFGWRRNG